MKQPRISAIEQPGGRRLNLETLRRLASAFDCALIVHFAPFSKLVDWARNFSPDEFQVPSFADDNFQKGAVAAERIGDAISAHFYRPQQLPTPAIQHAGATQQTTRKAEKIVSSFVSIASPEQQHGLLSSNAESPWGMLEEFAAQPITFFPHIREQP